ncbi:MAG: alanyl-tRNA editing protein [Lachnospiraceae bacterium]|nr:alanyl-tRNA editing protein [Lachnospiraceae bacterium]
MTKRLFDEDAYAVEFDAEVEECEKDDALYRIVLNQTLFFPEEGGQSPDKGTIEDIAVCDVQVKQGVIYHYTKTPLEVGNTVHGKIDFEHRFSNMQQHGGEHIFSGLVHSAYGYDNVGFHLSDQIVTMDYNGVLTKEQVNEIEEKANKVIFSNIDILVSFPSKEEAEAIPYRSKKEIDGPLRLVTIPGVDICACCAPHVRKTGEIGLLKVMSVQSYKGGVRLSILCGKRALLAFRTKNETVGTLMADLSSNEDALLENVKKIKNTSMQYKQKLSETAKIMVRREIEAIASGEKNVILFEEGLENTTARNIVNEMVERFDGITGIFTSSDNDSDSDITSFSFILASKDTDMKPVAAVLKEKLNAKGGGSSAMIQGSVTATREAILKCLGNNKLK